jgi:hypothetical protein
MVPYIPWIERRFRFEEPLRLFPNVLERLRGTPARLSGRIAHLSPAVLERRLEDRWSIQEHAGHLLDLSALDRARLDDFTAGRDRLTAADMTNRRTIEAAHNDRPIEHILADFERERAELVLELDAADEELVGRTAFHPRLEVPMRLIDWAYFVAEHDDHHLAVISSILKSVRTGRTVASR